MNMKIPQRYLQNRTSNIRQDYATINKSIVDKLNPPNLYRFFCPYIETTVIRSDGESKT